MSTFDVIIIGQGYAGLTAAALAEQKGLRTAAFEGMMHGGLITSINDLDPAPEGEGETGSDVASNLAMANMDGNIENVMAMAETLTRNADRSWSVHAEGEDYVAASVVLAMGATFRALGVPGEDEFRGRGVSACADCDGPMYSGKVGVIVGGGDSAYQEAAALAIYVEKVYLVQRGATPRARAHFVDHVASIPSIEVLPETEVIAITGGATGGLTGVTLRKEGDERELACSAVFPFVGLEPQTGFLPAEVARDAAGGVMVDERLQTGLPGLYAIGAVRSGFGGLLSDARADAELVIAALA